MGTTPVQILSRLRSTGLDFRGETILLPNKEEEEDEEGGNRNMTNPSNRIKVHYVIVFSNDADLFAVSGHPVCTLFKFFFILHPNSSCLLRPPSAGFGCPTFLLKVHLSPQLHWRPSLFHQEAIGPQAKWSPPSSRHLQDIVPCRPLVAPPNPVVRFTGDELSGL